MAGTVGQGVLFVRVRPGNLEKAMREITKNKDVERAEPLFGRYDLVVTGAFKDLEGLQRFSEEIRSKEFCESCAAHPTFDQWTREERTEMPWNAWTLVKAQNLEAVRTKLRQIAAVNRVYSTAGEHELIVRLSAERPEALQEAVLKQLQKVEGVRRTETLPTLRTEG
ncbi:MAG TPA: Lrp/AsnC ligand binding domain-containing protein [Thermoplasmata archaeon]|nr:Lrp/AsnC ligand binding domain-containing protein [Thermoplasmata archaeon]